MANIELPRLAQNDQEYANTKGYLQSISNQTGLNLYDHLVNLIKYLLEHHPNNAVDGFEQISQEVKRLRIGNNDDMMHGKLEPNTEFDLAQIQKKLFWRKLPTADMPIDLEPENPDEMEDDEEEESPLPNLMQNVFFFEQAGVGMNREEIFRVWMAMKQLAKKLNLIKVHFWGKILGISQNYYITQVEFEEGEDEEEEEEEEPEEEQEEVPDVAEEMAKEEGAEEEIPPPPFPKNKWKPPKKLAPEAKGRGANKNVYYACNEPGKPWFRLPRVTPEQITVCRQIKKFLTGRPGEDVISFPPFPGKEINLLAAQVIRITAATHVSPAGFYEMDEEEEPEEDEVPENIIQAEEFEPPELEELLDPSLAGWVHHSLYILKQGRCQYMDPNAKDEEEEEEEEEEEQEEEEEAKEEAEEEEPEERPPLLSPLEEDDPINGQPAWRVKISSLLVPPKYAVVCLSSMRWPGAYSFSQGQNFANLYLGFGHKYSGDNYSPPDLPKIMKEYVHPERKPPLKEALDPTVEDEAKLQAIIEKRKLKALQAAEEGGEEGKEEGDEAEEEDED